MTVKTKVKAVVKKVAKFIQTDYTTLPIAEREVMFRDELSTLMTKYNCGLSVAIVDSTPVTLPTIEA